MAQEGTIFLYKVVLRGLTLGALFGRVVKSGGHPDDGRRH